MKRFNKKHIVPLLIVVTSLSTSFAQTNTPGIDIWNMPDLLHKEHVIGILNVENKLAHIDAFIVTQ